MANHGKKSRVWLATAASPNTPVDVSDECTGMAEALTRDMAESSTLGVPGDAKTYVPGLNDATYTTDYRYTPEIYVHLHDLLLSENPVTVHVYPNGTAAGQLRLVSQILITALPLNTNIGDVAGGTVSFQRTGTTTIEVIS